MSITRPTLMTEPFANSGNRNSIPIEPPTDPNKINYATYSQGFPPVTMTPVEAGGKPPEGRDMNGILFETTSHTVFQNTGGQYRFDATLAATIGGYSIGDVLQSNDGLSSYVSLIDNNTTDFNSNPESIGTAWGQWAGGAIKSGIPSGGETGQALVKKSNSDDDVEWKFISSAPVGSSLDHYGTTAPEHYLVCDGSAISRAAYPELYAVIGTRYGAGDGTTTFNLPNKLGRVGQGSLTPGQKIEAGLPNISGTLPSVKLGVFLGSASGAFNSQSGASSELLASASSGKVVNTDFDASRSNPIYGASNTVQPPALTVFPCIKYE